MFILSVLSGLSVAIGWGVGDLASKHVVNDMGAFGGMIVMQYLSTAVTIALWLLLGFPLALAWDVLPYVALATLLQTLSWFFFFRALAVGYVSVISALYTLYALIPFGWQALRAELALTPLNVIGALFLLLAGILVAIDLNEVKEHKQDFLAKGVKEISVGIVFIGTSFLIADHAIALTDWRTVYLSNQLITCLILPVLLGLIGRFKETRLPGKWSWFLVSTLANLVAFTSLNYGMEHGEVGIVTVASCFSAAITAVLAWMVLKEKLRTTQYIGIALGIGGLIGLSL